MATPPPPTSMEPTKQRVFLVIGGDDSVSVFTPLTLLLHPLIILVFSLQPTYLWCVPILTMMPSSPLLRLAIAYPNALG